MHRWEPGLAAWLALTTALLVTLAVASVSWFGTRLLGDLADAEARARAELGVSSAQDALRQEADRLQRAVTLLAARPTLHRFLAGGDGAGLAAYMQRYCRDAALDACATVRDGELVATAGADLAWPEQAVRAAPGAEILRVRDAPASSLLVAAATVDDGAGAAAGTRVIAVRVVDAAFLARLSESVGHATQLGPPRPAVPAGGGERSVRYVADDAAGSISPHYLATAPVAAPPPDRPLALEVRLPAATVLAPVAALERRMQVISLLVVLLAIASAVLIGRYWVRGVRRLTAAARRIGSGQLDVPVDPERGAEIGVLAEAMERMRQNLLTLEAARGVRDTILANISHEFRTPLAAQLASIELLRDGIDTLPAAQQFQLVRSVEHGARRLTWLIDNLLESVRIESGQLGIRRQSVAIDEVLQAAREFVEPLVDRRGQSLKVGDLAALPRITGDRERLVQVFVNLLANASKFAPPATTVRIAAACRDDSMLEVWVEDEGPGPAEAGSAMLFDAFRRSSADDPDESGLGLGLFIVKSIVERHAGRVWMERTPLARTRVTVALPHGGSKA